MTLRSALGLMALALSTHCSAVVTTLGQECGGATGEAGGAEAQLELTTGGALEGSGGTTAVESVTSEIVEDSTGGTPSFGGTSFGAGGTSAIVAPSAAGGTKPTSSRAATGGTTASTTSTARVVRVQISTVNHLRPSIVLYYNDESTVVVTVGSYTDPLDPRICPCKTGERCVSDYIGANMRAESWWGFCVPANFTCQSSNSTDPVAGTSATTMVCE